MNTALAQADHAVEALRAERRDEYYPQFHLAPPAGWINDPNGLICIDGVYHAFFQHHPYSEHWGPMHWGHATSRDLIRWQHQPIATAPDTPYDKDGCFSGCAVDDNGVLTLIYTGHVWLGEPGDDSRAGSAMSGHQRRRPRLRQARAGAGRAGRHSAFPRSESLARERRMVAGGRCQRKRLWAVRLYRSADLRARRFDRVLAGAQAAHQGYMWECPDFFPLGNNTCCCSHRRGWRHRATATAIASRAAICSATGGLTATLG